MNLPLAHFGHWWASLAYALPVVLIGGAVAVGAWKERRAGRRRGGLEDVDGQ